MIKPKWDSKSVGEYERSLKPKVEDDDDIQDYKKPWVGLTWEEIDECFKITPDQYLPAQIYKRIEAKLKEKNT